MNLNRRRSRRARLAPYTKAEPVTIVDRATGVVREQPAYTRREYRTLVSGRASTR